MIKDQPVGNESSSHNLERNDLRRSSGAVKRSRPSEEDSAPLREKLKNFGQRATVLGEEISRLVSPSVALEEKLWSLVLELRPYVPASLSPTNSEMPDEMRRLCTVDSNRILKYTWLALRIYISVTNMATIVPGVFLHCILTLFSFLPVLGTLSFSDTLDEKILLKCIHQNIIVLCCRYPFLFMQLFHSLLRKETIGAFIFSPITGGDSSYGRCSIEIANPPPVHGVSSENKSLFVSCIATETVYESVCMARCLCDIVTDMFQNNIPIQPTLAERDVLIRLACSLLTVDLRENPLPQYCVGVSSQPLERFSSGHIRDENGPGLLQMLQTSAGSLLRVMLTNKFLIKPLHGPMLFYTLTQHLLEMSRTSAVDWEVTWELDLLLWLSEGVKESESSVVLLEKKRLAGSVETTRVPRKKWLDTLFLKPHVLRDVLRAIVGCACRQTSLGSLKAATILLMLLKETLSQKSTTELLMKRVFYDVASEMINALLETRLLPPMLWFADTSSDLGVLHQLLKLFPLHIVRPFVMKSLENRRSGEHSTDADLLANANAYAVMHGNIKDIQTTFSETWKRLVCGGNTLQADTIVIFLQASERSDVESIVQSSLESLVSCSPLSLRIQEDSPLHISLLYSSLVEKLPIINKGSRYVSYLITNTSIRLENNMSTRPHWCLIGVLRGFRKLIVQKCQSSISSGNPSCFGEVNTKDKNSVNVFMVLKEINDVIEALASTIPNLSFEDGANDDSAVLLFWQHLVALVTETFFIVERLRSHSFLQRDMSAMKEVQEIDLVNVIAEEKGKKKKKKSRNGGEAVVVVVEEEEEEEEAGRPRNDLPQNEEVFLVSSKQRPQRRQCKQLTAAFAAKENEERHNNTHNSKCDRAALEEVLQCMCGHLEKIACAARQLLFARPSETSDLFGDTLLAFLCLCVAITPIRWEAIEKIILTRGLSHGDRIIRRGYMALVLRILLTRWNDATSIAHVFPTNLLELEGHNETQQNWFLESLHSAFTGQYQTVLVGKEGGMNHGNSFFPSCVVVASFPFTVAPFLQPGEGRAACISVLDVCIKIWENPTVSLSIKSTALSAAYAVMLHLSWSVVDLCWRDAGMIHTSFFKAMCDVEGSDVREVIRASLDDLLSHSLLSDDGEGKLKRIVALFGEEISPNRIFCSVMAYILIEHARDPVPVKLEKIRKLLGFLSKPLEELPEMMLHSREPLIVSLLYLEAGRLLQGGGMENNIRTNNNNSNNNSGCGGDVLSSFNLAVEVVLSILDSPPSEDKIAQALATPMTRTTEGRALTKDVFYVLDAMAELVGINNGSLKESRQVPACITQRCLCSLTLLIRSLGSYATSIAPKLPAILEHCSERPQLVQPVCAVWRDLLANCTKEYLKKHSPAIVVDLLSMEPLAKRCSSKSGGSSNSSGSITSSGPGDGDSGDGADEDYYSYNDSSRGEGDALSLLEEAMQIVYESSCQEAFWESYFKVMGRTNMLISRLKMSDSKSVVLSRSSSLAKSSVCEKSNAILVVDGFLSVMDSSSTKCKEVFVRALYDYLSTTDSAGRMEMTHAAEANPQLIPTLLNCACELREDHVEYILASVGMIGALSHSHASLLATERKLMMHRGNGKSLPAKNGSNSDLRGVKCLLEDVLDWRALAYKLLRDYCSRALGNTADPKMHDRAAYAIQQLLRVCTDEERPHRDRLPLQSQELLHIDELNQYPWWSKLEPSCRQMLEGYTITRYDKVVITRTELHSPVYTAKMPFSEWLDAWFCNLVGRCDGLFGRMMDSVRNMAKGDHTLITFLLPHIILHLLLEGNPDHCNAVFTEITNLLFSVAAGALREKEQTGSLYSQIIMREAATPGAWATGVEEHIQELFHIIEAVERLHLTLVRTMHQLSTQRSGTVDQSKMLQIDNVCKQFLLRVKWTTRVRAAVSIGSNMRALRCIECQRYLPSIHEVMKENILLQRIFASLGDRDSARSLHRAQAHEREEAAFSYENNGEWSLALQTSELVLQQCPNSIEHQFTVLRCMQQLGQLHLMSCYSQALLMHSSRAQEEHKKHHDSVSWEAKMAALQNYANEAAWRLGEWKNIESRRDLPVSLALPIVAFTNLLHRNGTLNEVLSACEVQRRKIAPFIRAAFKESNAQVYPHIVVLHALTDIETAAKFVTSLKFSSKESEGNILFLEDILLKNKEHFEQFGSLLQERADLTEATSETQELLVSLHRSIFREFRMNEKVTETWMQYAKILRNEGFLEEALSAAKRACIDHNLIHPSYYTTIAKLLYEMKMPNQAIEFAENGVNDSNISHRVRSKLRLFVTRWKQETGYQTSSEVIAGYMSSLKMNESEAAHHYLALFYDTLYRSTQNSMQDSDLCQGASEDDSEDKKKIKNVECYVLKAINHFGLALRSGTKRMIVSLPRMLTLWLDCSTPLAALCAKTGRNSESAESVLNSMNEMMKRYLIHEDTKLPPTQLITALPQLLSRIIHSSAPVVSIVTGAIVELMMIFPQQCLWQVLPIEFSKQRSRSETAHNQIVLEFVNRNPGQKKHVESMLSLFKSFIDLCNCSASSLSSGRLSSEASLDGQPFMQRIQRIFASMRIILPTMANLSPNVVKVTNDSVVFAGNAAFQCLEDRVTIMSSLQKPKRITVLSDEGERVSFLCKARDEPRKDMRMMEIASLMNSFFLTDPEPRRKRFALRRYAITALNDDSAIIEWVNNISTFRKVVEDCYAMDGTGVRVSQVKTWKTMVENGSLSKVDMLQKHIFPKTKPVLHSWFHHHFHSHQEWFDARNLYTQAVALWSIAGHIVGLGDRHGENLMLDLRCGELMHVDFACLFDKGETLDIPERVRFRLTQNVVDGMGLLGVDGPFRASCHLALRCQMKNKTAVMSIVETLLHEPLVEWTRQSSLRHKNVNPKHLIGRVSRRLDGFLDLYNVTGEKDTLALSCEGQVSRLISHSSAVENLSEMYTWWMPWL